MRQVASVLIVIGVVTMLAGCASSNRPPQLRAAVIEPDVLQPGDIAVISVEVKDRFEIVNRVEAVVVEDTRMKLPLYDDGQNPDKTAGDGIWTLEVEVPFQAVPGQFTLDITAYDADGRPILVRDSDGNSVALSQMCTVTIQYPPE